MKLFIVFAGALVSVAAFPLNEAKITTTPTFASYEERIYNGTTARVGQFPYQVGLLLTPDGKVFNWCGGSLISEKWVLTAAHCIYSAYVAYVYLGATTSKNAEVYYTVFSNDFVIHRGYMGQGHLNDIALIKIPKTRFSKKIQIVHLPAMSMLYESFLLKYAIISGWGQTSSHSNATADSLQWARLQIIANNDCSHYYGDITDSDLCVSTNGSSTTCQGDSGGPLVLESKRILVGLSSFSSLKGCQTGYPAGFTRITNYLCWIKYHTGLVY